MTRIQRLQSPTRIITAVKTCTNHYQKKGHNQQFETLVDYAREGDPFPFPAGELLWGSLLSFEVQRSIRENQAIDVNTSDLLD
ncbi:hypothetical protein [Haloquadratum walsbyi]|uniref:hypothetical protein n=1 Tax=Haloquadratum walsbyi TaxID=293091 RepID=UPI000677B2DC|nr:hypothetical protein [Haloquadratum walsbyi]